MTASRTFVAPAFKKALRTITRYEECQGLRAQWNRIAARNTGDISQFDVTATFEWAMALWRSFLESKDQNVVVLEGDSGIAGLLPLLHSSRSIHGVQCRTISAMTELFAGRCGFLLEEASPENLAALIEHLYAGVPNWDVFLFTLVEHSAQHRLWTELAQEMGYAYEQVVTQTSPYIELTGTFEQYVATLPKKFASGRIRGAEKKLRAKAAVQVREFSAPAEVERYQDALLEVEKCSWKEAAGTSLTLQRFQESFHMDMIRSAAESGWLLGYVLELGGEPIAYLHGLLYQGQFCNLKSSYKEQYQELSPGHVLRASVLERLYGRNVALYDFMGVFDDHKRVWTNTHYTRISFALYNRTVRANAARLGRRVKEAVGRGSRLFGLG